MRADAKLKRQKLIEAATEQFRTRTNSEVTLEGIAKDAGVGIATLYRHFPTREDLRLACALNLFDTLDTVLARTVEEFDTDPRGTWEAAIWRLADYGIGVLVGALADSHPRSVDTEVPTKRDQFFARVQWPLLMPTTLFVLINAFINAFRMVDHLFILTRGGPDNATTLLLYYLYEVGFSFWDTAYAAAITVVLVAILAGIALLQFFVLDRRVHYQ